MCGGFTCTKNALTALNILYILVSFVLIGVAAYGRVANQVTSIAIIGGIIACGVFLFILSLLGLIGAAKHHQVLLFFYMVILFILFVVQFSIACACLAFGNDQQNELAKRGWDNTSKENRQRAQTFFNCCGFIHPPLIKFNTTDCPKVECCADNDCSKSCDPCAPKIKNAIGNALEICGWVGMFFSFTEFIGVWLTIRYRNQKNPRADPSAFL
jgi:tetraspanin-13/31